MDLPVLLALLVALSIEYLIIVNVRGSSKPASTSSTQQTPNRVASNQQDERTEVR